MSIDDLAKLLRRTQKSVNDDIKALEEVGLIEVLENGLYSVPWNEIRITIRIAE